MAKRAEICKEITTFSAAQYAPVGVQPNLFWLHLLLFFLLFHFLFPFLPFSLHMPMPLRSHTNIS